MSAEADSHDPDHKLLAWLSGVLPPETGLSGGAIGRPPPGPYPEEEALVARAVETRIREFRAGRAYAREALLQIGRPPSAILRGPAGAPLWPTGCVGSIAHDRAYAIAVVGDRDRLTGLGIDVETAAALDADLVRLVAGPEELARAAGAIPPGLDAGKCLFVAKECVVKLLGGRGDPLPDDLRQIAVAVSAAAPDALTFRVVAAGPGGHALQDRAFGHLGRRGDRLAAVLLTQA